ncbi:HigA family addiction module antitoxin [Humibacter soli]
MDELNPMFNPPHPGEFITEVYLEPLGMSGRELAGRLGVAPSTIIRLLNGTSHLSPEMAARLAKAFGSTPRFWLTLQTNYDLWRTRDVDVSSITPINTAA